MQTSVEPDAVRERALAGEVGHLSRRLRVVEGCLAGLVIAVAVACGTNLNASAKTEQVVRARSFVVADEQGRVRAELGLVGETTRPRSASKPASTPPWRS